MSLGACKLKQQRDTTIYLLEWLNSTTVKTPNAGEDVKQLQFLLTAEENAKSYNNAGRQLNSFLQTYIYIYTHTGFPYSPTIALPGTYSNDLKIYVHTKHVHKYLLSPYSQQPKFRSNQDTLQQTNG